MRIFEPKPKAARWKPPAAASAARGAWRAATAGVAGPVPHRPRMEQAFGRDFSDVPVHVGRAAELDALDAKAATDGERVTFASPSPSARQVAHELAHVVQMRGTAADGSRLSRPGSPAEREADRIADRAAGGEPVSLAEAAPAALHRDIKSGAGGASPQAADDHGTVDGNVIAAKNGVGVKSTAKISKLDPAMEKVIIAVAQVATASDLPKPVITSGHDSKHKKGSAHYKDRALDFRGNNITVVQGKALRADVAAEIGADYDVIFEEFKDATNNHLHVEYDPD